MEVDDAIYHSDLFPIGFGCDEWSIGLVGKVGTGGTAEIPECGISNNVHLVDGVQHAGIVPTVLWDT